MSGETRGSRTATVIEVYGYDALRSEDATRALTADLADAEDIAVRLEYAGD